MNVIDICQQNISFGIDWRAQKNNTFDIFTPSTSRNDSRLLFLPVDKIVVETDGNHANYYSPPAPNYVISSLHCVCQ